MAATAGNSHATSANSSQPGTQVYDDLTKLLTIIERIGERQVAGVVGYSNSELAWNLARLTYSNTGNYGTPSGRYASKGVTYNANTTIQGVVTCLRDQLLANT